jgi:adenosylcobinamide-phosphate synthase
MSAMRTPVLFLALSLDILFGDPPNRLHPVAWMGSLIAWAQRCQSQGNPACELAYGASISLGGSLLIFLLGKLLIRILDKFPFPLNWLAEAALLKSTISLRGLGQASREVEAALIGDDLPSARRLLAWHLVSRETKDLDSSEVAAATIESIAENTSDGILAPMFYYMLGGLPLAFAYRFANTADAMLGYHTPSLEWMGKIPARLDDLLNYLPARLTGLIMILAASLCNEDARQALRVMKRDARNTLSPNAGYPMSAMAGALGVELEKSGQYKLGANGYKPRIEHIRRARRMTLWASALGTALLAIVKLCRE